MEPNVYGGVFANPPEINCPKLGKAPLFLAIQDDLLSHLINSRTDFRLRLCTSS